ncbi:MULTISPECIES: phosphonate C-P lyase system protein PhnH [unclassified Beijerinckia]|uniref:phosphonate C-P lyase system protein PhnH n=1 Tax=unclassified Beijerinckia TaxID=2638183 RepID=UPI000899F5A7|nr:MULTISPECIES: phosphonate C-P lyase system protein PhnH [unclassified Beijerinckia]MDH7797127.1 alpha-D-ribose 1-methylphosphonate 5-triphosphate synthase subunit PhnH [Beijerinckia sp. GAS462]SEC73320.1 alpha-D-ribose 1-methylphosphonate 5-triphosphate synthase subunit PhnH [Beijerinckia sp. 28-YEA-48]
MTGQIAAQHVAALEGGFTDPVLNAQAAFRIVMDAMARPATVLAMQPLVTPPAPLTSLAGTIACTLIDADTPFWLDPVLGAHEALRTWLGFHTGARATTAAGDAHFALIGDPKSMLSLDQFAQGSQDYPDQSTTLILQVESLHKGTPLAFEGPGIKGRNTLALRGLPADFAHQWRDNTKRFPRGVDLILTTADAVACLPRTARLVQTES